MERFLALWDNVRSGLWFRPGLLTLVAIVAAFSVLKLDRWVASADALSMPMALGGDPQSARQVLSTIAGGMITIAGVSFSIVIIALTLASNQFSPRVLRNFTNDRVSQTTLGVFVGTFVYSILVLRVVHGSSAEVDAYVPIAGVLLAIAAAVVSLAFFIYFIHHIASSIQVSRIVYNVAEETHEAIEALLSSEHSFTGPARVRAFPLPVPSGWRASATDEGYVQRVDERRLARSARDAGVVLDLLVGPGDFVAEGSPLGVSDRAPEDPEALAGNVRGALLLSRKRSMHEDPSYGFREIIDIALKAVSPSMNDPNTAMNCIDFLGAFLRRMADRDWPPAVLSDEDGEVRVRLPAAEYGDYVSFAFTEIRRYGGSDLAVTLRILEALAGAADATGRPDRHAALWEEATRVMEGADSGIAGRADRQAVDWRFGLLAGAMERDATPHLLENETGTRRPNDRGAAESSPPVNP